MNEVVDEIVQKLRMGATAEVTSITNKRLQFRIGSDRFSVAMRNLRSFRKVGMQFRSLSIERDHPVLREFNEQPFELYIYTRPNDVDRYIAALRECTKRVTNRNLRHFTDYPIHFPRFRQMLEAGEGLLLEGPKSLVEAIQHFSDDYEVKTSSLAVTRTKTPMQLLILDDSWMIASRFTFRRLPENDS